MKVFLLWHTHEFPDREDDDKLIGVYATEADAEAARQRSLRQPGFSTAPEGFHISPYEVGKDEWTEGYVTILHGELVPATPSVKQLLRAELIGPWRAALHGPDLLNLKPVEARSQRQLILHTDGTAHLIVPDRVEKTDQAPPTPKSWEVADDRVLTILIPVAPMPEYESPGWTQEAIRYDILAVSPTSLTLSNRRFDGESILVYQRVDVADYEQRAARDPHLGLRRLSGIG